MSPRQAAVFLLEMKREVVRITTELKKGIIAVCVSNLCRQYNVVKSMILTFLKN